MNDIFGRVQQVHFEANPSLVDNWMRGKYASEEVNELTPETTGIPLDRLGRTFERDCKSMRIASYLLAETIVLRKVCAVF